MQDKTAAIAAVQQDGAALQFVDACFKKDKDVVLAAVRQWGLSLKYADPSVKQDKEIILAAVEQNGHALQFAEARPSLFAVSCEMRCHKGQELLAVRVLQRRPQKAPGFFFLDVLQMGSLGKATLRLLQVSVAPQGPFVEEVVAWYNSVRLGDFLLVSGHWHHGTGSQSEAQSVRFRVDGLQVAETHQSIHGERAFSWSSEQYKQYKMGCTIDSRIDDMSALGQSAPELILQCAASHAQRLAAYCRETFPGVCAILASPQQGCPDRAILLKQVHSLSEVLSHIIGNTTLSGALRRIFALEPAFRTWSFRDAVSHVGGLIDCKGSNCIVRVQAYPRYLEQATLELLDTGRRLMGRTQFTHIASLVYVDAAYSVGLVARSLSVANLSLVTADCPKVQQASRAHGKLQEALERSGWKSELALQHGLMFAVDVGSAPGGWSEFLASATWGCREVCAVDPAKLAPGLLKLNQDAADVGRAGRIHHFRMRWSEAFDELRRSHSAIDVLVCDANFPCNQTLDMVIAAVDLLKPHAYLVLTFKNCCRTRLEFDSLKLQQLERLREFCTEVREVQLLANRKLETTVLARFAGSRRASCNNALVVDELPLQAYCRRLAAK